MNVIWTRQAELDRLSIFEFVAAENPAAAVRLDLTFDASATRLATFPLSGRPGLVTGTRELLPHKSYRMI